MKFNKFLGFFGFISLITVLSLMLIPVSPALAFADGPKDAGVGTNVSTIGTEAWQNPQEITTPGAPYASVVLYHLHTYSNYLVGTQYGFNLPLDATVVGIEVGVNRMSSARNPSIVDNVVRLVKGGNLVGDNKASTGNPWVAGTFTLINYGSPTDTWGTDWTPLDINAADFGVAFAARRDNNGNNDRIAYIDALEITVYYAYATNSLVECETPVVYGDSVLCTATITRVGSNLTPTGEVSWASDADGTFEPNPCTLSGSNGTATCTANYTPMAVGSGSHTVTADYAGDEYFTPSSDQADITVLPRPVTVTAAPQTKDYGDPDPLLTYQLTQGDLVFGDTFTGTLTREAGEDVGTYAILQGTLALSDNYQLTYVGADLTIEKADPQCDVTPYNVDYDGNEHTATGVCTGVFGETLDTLDLSGTSHTDAGIYTDTWTFTDLTGNYNDQDGDVQDVINQVAALCTVTPYDVVYDGSEHLADGECLDLHGEPLEGLDLSATAHTDAGVYTDAWVFSDPDGNYADQEGTVVDTISQAAADCTVTPYDVTYDAVEHVADGSCLGVMNEPLDGLDLTATAHTDAGSYLDPWYFSDVNGNYADQDGTVSDNISPADAVCSVIGYDLVYDGTEHMAQGACTGVLGELLEGLDLSLTAHTNAGVYTDPWTFLDSNGNYNAQGGNLEDTISQAAPTCEVTGYTLEYDREAHTATGACTGVLGELLEGLNLDGTTHTEIGSYPADPWSFTDVTGNYTNQEGTVSNEITLRFITIAADAVSKLVGQLDPPLTYQVTSGTLLAGDSFTGALARVSGEHLGSYAILQGTLSLPGYYEITYIGADLTITGIRYILPVIYH